MPPLLPDQLQVIRQLVRDCGQLALNLATEQFQVFEKGAEDYVTSVDRLLDQRLAAGLATLFPGDRIITEENTQSWAAFATQSDRLWLVDPVDGTDDFINGKPHYSVMVGLLAAQQPLAGWIYAPALNALYYGAPSWGLFQEVGDPRQAGGGIPDPEPLVPRAPAPPSDHFCPILLGYKDQRRYGAAIAQQLPQAQFDSIGSFGLKVMRVICGQAGLYVYLNGRVKLWDTTGPIALAKAAGLVCCDLSGEPLRFTPDAADPKTLAHYQTIVVGWPQYVEALRSPIQQAVAQVDATQPQSSLNQRKIGAK